SWSKDSRFALLIAKDYQDAPQYELNQGVKVTFVTPKDKAVRDSLYLIDLANKTGTLLRGLSNKLPYLVLHGWVNEKEFIFSEVDRAFQTRIYYRQKIQGPRLTLFTEGTKTFLDDYPISARKQN